MKTKEDISWIKKYPLPSPVTLDDLKYKMPDMKRGESFKAWDKRVEPFRVAEQFEMYYTERFGWVICTLPIRQAGWRARSRGVATDRTYGVVVKTGEVCRVGWGPHVLKKVQVYVRRNRLKDFEPLLALKQKGETQANEIRDRISTRRARGALWRMDNGYF